MVALASALGACAAPVGGDAAVGSSDEAIAALKCPLRYTHDCESDEGPKGPILYCTPCEPSATYWTEVVGGDSANTAGLPDGDIQQTLYNLGCTLPVVDGPYPYFACPTGAHSKLPANINWSGQHLPTCAFSGGVQQRPDNGTECETIWTSTDPYWVPKEVGTLVSGYEYVWVTQWLGKNITGRGCTSSCAIHVGPSPILSPVP
jgi:hypothetical protein